MKYSFKFLFLGNTGTGKTSIVTVSSNNTFNHIFTSTIGVDFTNLNIERNGDFYNLRMWDTGGHERFNFIIKSYYRDITALIVVYDITNIYSFNNVKKIIQDYEDTSGRTDTPILILGNKTDLESRREVSIEMGRGLAEKLDCIFLECSAKSVTNIKDIYFDLLDYVREKIDVSKDNEEQGVKLINNRKILSLDMEDTGEINQPKVCCQIL